MAIDYDSGTGLFTKLGALIRVVNLFESFETGDLQTKLTAIYNKLESVNIYDDQARQEFHRQDAILKGTLRAWKADLIPLVQMILAQELHEAESFYTQDLQQMLEYLKFCMLRDSETVDGSTVNLTGPSAGANRVTGSTIVGNFSLLASKYFPTVQGADSSSQENGIIRSNSYVVTCIQNSVSGAEQFRIEGDLPLNGLTHPNWENAGEAGTLQMISSISNSLLRNGGFESLNSSSNGPADWTVNTGTWETHLKRIADPYRGTYALELTGDAKITQTLQVDTLRPWTKYLVTYKIKKTGTTPDGTVNIGFTGTSGFSATITVSSGVTTSYALGSFFFNTGADPGSIVDFIIERTGSATGEVVIDEVTLTPIPLIHGLGLAVVAGSTDPALGDFWTVTAANQGEGTFQRFFGRWFNFLLPGDTTGNETIDDALAE